MDVRPHAAVPNVQSRAASGPSKPAGKPQRR
jgi:hypothetical protein